MHRRYLLLLWGGLFALCAVLGFFPEPEGFWKVLFTALSILHFLPPMVLLYLAKKENDLPCVRLIRNLSGLSLMLTLLLLVGNLLSVGGGRVLGDMLHYMLIVVSSPMICSGYWVLSLFLWACLFAAGISSSK